MASRLLRDVKSPTNYESLSTFVDALAGNFKSFKNLLAMKWRQILLTATIGFVSAIGGMWCYSKFIAPKDHAVIMPEEKKLSAMYAKYIDNNIAVPPENTADFIAASETAIPAVVHIKTKIVQKQGNQSQRNKDITDDLFERFFNLEPDALPEQRGSGSGVLISEDGYIVTNNHVIAGEQGGNSVANEIVVALSDKKTYKAKLIGRDPASDLAVIKIDGNDLPYLSFGNADDTRIGQWVLAVGYPLTLETTVTAGIISAKGRTIGINRRQSQAPIESFIQTDAAVNLGNSGGALINTDGELIGVVSSFLGPNGAYAGYSFAIPSNLVKKIVNDLIHYGKINLPYLGVQSDDDKDTGDGVPIGSVTKNSAAEEAGLKGGDILTKINDMPVNSWSELRTVLARFSAGDEVKISFIRDGKKKTATARLKSKSMMKDEGDDSGEKMIEKYGVVFKNAGEEVIARNNISGGVIVKEISGDSPFHKARVEEGFIITRIEGKEIKNVESLKSLFSKLKGTIQVEGIFDGAEGNYIFPVKLGN